MASKATPKAGITLLSKEDDRLKFVHSPTASGDLALKHKLGNKLTLGVGFSVRQPQYGSFVIAAARRSRSEG